MKWLVGLKVKNLSYGHCTQTSYPHLLRPGVVPFLSLKTWQIAVTIVIVSLILITSRMSPRLHKDLNLCVVLFMSPVAEARNITGVMYGSGLYRVALLSCLGDFNVMCILSMYCNTQLLIFEFYNISIGEIVLSLSQICFPLIIEIPLEFLHYNIINHYHWLFTLG